MRTFKAEVTLNERDSLEDLLGAEKQLLKTYATVISESVSNGMRKLTEKHLKEVIDDQINVFFLMTERGYYTVSSAKEEDWEKIKQKFSAESNQLA